CTSRTSAFFGVALYQLLDSIRILACDLRRENHEGQCGTIHDGVRSLGEPDAFNASLRGENLLNLSFHDLINFRRLDCRAAIGEQLVEVWCEAEAETILTDCKVIARRRKSL